MEFEWDEDKRAANVARHGIDFLDVSLLSTDARLSLASALEAMKPAG